MQYSTCHCNKLDRWHTHLNFFFTCSLFIRAWHLFTSLTCSKHLLQVTPCNLRTMEIRLSKIPYTNPFIVPQSVLKEICPFRNYANICIWMHVHRTTFERNSSLGYHHLVWSGKTKHSSWKGLLSYFRTTLLMIIPYPGTYIFRRTFLKGLIYGGKFAFQNRLC